MQGGAGGADEGGGDGPGLPVCMRVTAGPIGVVDTILASSLAGIVLGTAQALAGGALARPFGFAPSIAIGAVASLFLPQLWLMQIF